MLFLFDKLLQNTENSSRTTGRGLGRGGNGLDTNPARVEPLQGHPIGQERVCELRRKLQRAAGQWGRGSFPLKVMAHAYLQCDGSVQVIQRCTKIPYTTLREAKRRVDAHGSSRLAWYRVEPERWLLINAKSARRITRGIEPSGEDSSG